MNVSTEKTKQTLKDDDGGDDSVNGQETSVPTLFHRFVRLNPRFDKEETLSLLKQELNATTLADKNDNRKKDCQQLSYPCPVTWLPPESGFYALPADFSLVQSAAYQQGRLYGQDVSSGAAVAALLEHLQKNLDDDGGEKKKKKKKKKTLQSWRILDLCCAPGQKLMALADGLAERQQVSKQSDTTMVATTINTTSPATVVGVDVSADRLAVCQKTLRKYYCHQRQKYNDDVSSDNATTLPRIRLYCADGTVFGKEANHQNNLIWDSTCISPQDAERKRLNKSARKRHERQLRAVADWDWKVDNEATTATTIELFDAVLVDAECSTDGSIKHVQKRRRLEWTEDRLPELVDLQKKLALRGFQLVKPGGILVYATCSLSRDQNEGVVKWLLQQVQSSTATTSAELIPLSFPTAPSSVRAGDIEGTLRFSPSDDPTELTGGGFFLAAFRKNI